MVWSHSFKGYKLRKQSIKCIEIQTPEKKNKKRKKSKPSVSVSYTMNLSAIPPTPPFPPDFNEPNIPIPLIVLLLVAIFVVVIAIVYYFYRESYTYQPLDEHQEIDPHLRDNMPNFIYQPGVSGMVPFEERKCAWCQEEFTCGDQLSSLPSCGHVFHSDCIGDYMLRRNTCPVCRQPIALPEVQD